MVVFSSVVAFKETVLVVRALEYEYTRKWLAEVLFKQLTQVQVLDLTGCPT